MMAEQLSPEPGTEGVGKVVRLVLRRSRVWAPIALALGGHLAHEGWYRSFRTGRSVDRDGRPLPWYTYSCRAFLESRLTGSMRVFEYGAGMSSLWYAERVHDVVSVEHDARWAERVRRDAPANCRVVLAPDRDSYLSAIADFEPFDIVVVDGEHRPAATIAALDGLTADGVIVWDNSNLAQFQAPFSRLETQGFRRIAFAGLGPVSRSAWETSILYRSYNCLGI